MTKKIGFWSVFELVTISQIGSGLVLPASLAVYGVLTIKAWLISSAGALILALMFAKLCKRFPRTGGPSTYVHEAFGSTCAFFTGWTYWIISWISTIAIIISAVGYLTPLIGDVHPIVRLGLEILIIVGVCAFNLKGVHAAGNARFIIVLLKLIPLIIVPVAALWFFDLNNFAVAPVETVAQAPHLLNQVVIFTFWGFIGFESPTTAANEIHNPAKTIPVALIVGTFFVCVVYIISTIGIMGIMPSAELAQSEAPYADVARLMFGDYFYWFISLLAAVICIGAINSWTLASSQIALSITQDGLMPKFFARTNRNGVPVMPLCISCIGSIIFLFLTQNESMMEKVNMIIDLSVVSFLFVYVLCCLAYLKIIWEQKRSIVAWEWGCGFASLGFCLWIICSTPIMTLLLSSLFVLSGVPAYYLRRKKYKRLILSTSIPSQPVPTTTVAMAE